MPNINIKNLPIIYGVILLISLIIMGFLWNVVSKVFTYLLGNTILWGLFLIGVIVFYILHRKFPKQFTLKEMAISIVAVFPGLFTLFAILFSTTTNLSDTEYLNYGVAKIVHIEDYYTEREVCETCTDKDGKTYSCNCRMVCDVYHPDSYYIVKTSGGTESINAQEYENIKHKLGTPENKVASSQIGQCSGDGSEWEVVWNGTWETMIPTSETHLYINYVKATSTLYKLTGITGNKEHIKPYPTLENNGFGYIDINRVLTAGVNVPQQIKDSLDFLTDRHLVTLGTEKQCNILYYFVDEPQSFYGYLEQEWIKGKKNDIIVIIGMKSWPKVDWVRIMCWSKQALFQVQLRDRILDMKEITSAASVVQTVTDQVRKDHNDGGFERQSMEDYRYLLKQVNLGIWPWIVIILIVAMMMIPLVLFFFGTDDFD